MSITAFNAENTVAGCRRNERPSQELLFRHFSKNMYSVSLSYAEERGTAKRILEESFIKIFTDIQHYNENCSLETWIRQTVINAAMEYISKNEIEHKYYRYIEVKRNWLPGQNFILRMLGFERPSHRV